MKWKSLQISINKILSSRSVLENQINQSINQDQINQSKSINQSINQSIEIKIKSINQSKSNQSINQSIKSTNQSIDRNQIHFLCDGAYTGDDCWTWRVARNRRVRWPWRTDWGTSTQRWDGPGTPSGWKCPDPVSFCRFFDPNALALNTRQWILMRWKRVFVWNFNFKFSK